MDQRFVSAYKFQLDLKFKKDNKSTPIPIRSEFIRYIIIESLYTTRMMPVAYISMVVDYQLYNDIYESQNSNDSEELSESVFLLKINRFDKLAQSALFQTSIDDKFDFIISKESPDYTKELSKGDTSGTGSYRQITLALLSVSLLNAIRAERNKDNSVIVSGIFNNIDTNTLVAKVFEGIDNYIGGSSKSKPSVIKPPVHNTEFKKYSLIIPPMDSRKKIIDFIFNKAPFYDTQYTFFIDFGRAYLIDRTKDGYKIKDNTYHDVIFDVRDITESEAFVEGVEIKKNSYVIYINPTKSIIIPNRDQDKTANTMISVTDNGTLLDATVNNNGSDKSDTKYVFTRGSNALLYKNNVESNTVTITLGKENLDGSIFTPNKRYRIKYFGDNKRYDGYYYLCEKKEIIVNNSGDIKGATEFILKKVGKISNIGDTNEDGEIENAGDYKDIGSKLSNEYIGTVSSTDSSRYSQSTNINNSSTKKVPTNKKTMVTVKTNTTTNYGTGLGSDTINKYNNGTLSGSLLKTDPVSLGDSPSLSIEEQIRIAEANRVKRIHGNEVDNKSSGPVKVVKFNENESNLRPI